MRVHINKALKTQCKAIQTALKKYNTAAATLGRPPLDWKHISTYGSLAEFSLLQECWADIRHQPWAQASNHKMVKVDNNDNDNEGDKEEEEEQEEDDDDIDNDNEEDEEEEEEQEEDDDDGDYNEGDSEEVQEEDNANDDNDEGDKEEDDNDNNDKVVQEARVAFIQIKVRVALLWITADILNGWLWEVELMEKGKLFNIYTTYPSHSS